MARRQVYSGGRRGWAARGEGGEQDRPGREDEVDGQGAQVLEEPLACAGRLAGGAPERVGELADGVAGEGEQVERGEHGGEVPPAMPEVVLEMVALGLQDVEALVLDLPPCPAARRQLGDGRGADRQVGDEAVAVGELARAVEDLDLQSVDGQGLGAIAQRHVFHPEPMEARSAQVS